MIVKVISGNKLLPEIRKLNSKSLQKNFPVFKFDYSQIYECISNIVTNAVQAIPSEGEK